MQQNNGVKTFAFDNLKIRTTLMRSSSVKTKSIKHASQW